MTEATTKALERAVKALELARHAFEDGWAIDWGEIDQAFNMGRSVLLAEGKGDGSMAGVALIEEVEHQRDRALEALDETEHQRDHLLAESENLRDRVLELLGRLCDLQDSGDYLAHVIGCWAGDERELDHPDTAGMKLLDALWAVQAALGPGPVTERTADISSARAERGTA